MSRYLTRLVRETHARLRPPAALRLAPRAPAILEEIHEERPAAPATAVDDAPAVAAKVPDPILRHATPTPGRPEPCATSAAKVAPSAGALDASPRDGGVSPPTVRAAVTAPAAASEPRISQATSTKSTASVAQDRTAEQATKTRAPSVPSKSLLSDTQRSAKGGREQVEFSIPESVVTWLQGEPDGPDQLPAKSRPRATVTPPAASPTVIDVNIGTIDVVIDPSPPPPARASQRPPSRPAPPAPAPPRMAGRLARQYLDR